MTAIVIPAADVVPDAANLLEALLKSIEVGKTHEAKKIIVCFDACNNDFVNYFRKEFPFIHPIINTGNRMNFAGNANSGLRYAHQVLGESAIVVNQDCILPPALFMRLLYGDGIASATQVSVLPEPPFKSEMHDTLVELMPPDMTPVDHPKVTGFCMFLNSKLMDKVGYFDEHFKATFEDDDICARARLAGFPVQQVPVAVHHYVSRCGSYDGSRLGLNLTKFRVKWSIPYTVTHAEFAEFVVKNHVWQPAMAEK